MIDRRAFASSLILVAAGRPAAARADGASAWSRDSRSAVRLIAGGSAGKGASLRHQAGLHVTLGAGMKTYWRTPGDSGVPPTFDWSASENLADVAVSWPAPRRFPDGTGYSIGYKSDVVFPLAVTPADPDRPVRLALKLDYAVCDQICIPAKGEAQLALAAGPPPDPALAGLLAAFRSRVPSGEVAGLGLALASLSRAGRHPIAILLAKVGDEEGTVDLFAEGPDAQWALPLPEPLDEAGPVRRFKLTLDGVPKGVDPLSHPVTFTLVAGQRALEKTLKLA